MRYFVVFFLLVLATPVLSQEPRTVAVVGRGSARVEPDTASSELGVRVRGTDLAAVKEETNRRIGGIIQALKSLGLNDDALSTSQIDLSLEMPRQSGKQEAPRFEMYRQVRVQVTDLSLLGSILEAAIDAGSNEIRGIRYSTSKEKELKERLLGEAIKHAKAQAERLAGGFGAKLAKVIRIQSDRGGASSSVSLVVSTTSDPFGGEEYRPGEIDVERSVSVVFELVD